MESGFKRLKCNLTLQFIQLQLWQLFVVARGSVAGWSTTLQAGRSRVRFPMRRVDFSIDVNFPADYDPGVDSAFNRN
jgi:hypothetical protein